VIEAILDTGPLVGSLDRDDQWHEWSAKQFAAIQQPALTCEAVISEACFLLRDVPDSRQKIFALVERGVLRVVPVLPMNRRRSAFCSRAMENAWTMPMPAS
jgi:predicted nucleic acid-binding protein